MARRLSPILPTDSRDCQIGNFSEFRINPPLQNTFEKGRCLSSKGREKGVALNPLKMLQLTGAARDRFKTRSRIEWVERPAITRFKPFRVKNTSQSHEGNNSRRRR